jgi:phage baseplate assembly protein W
MFTKQSIYRGFSTQKLIDSKGNTFVTTDVETIKQDILNQIYTIKGERVMFPDFGTRIPLMAFEPLDPTTIQIIKDDLNNVFNSDPRVKLIDLAVLALPDNNAIVAIVDIQYIELGSFETLNFEFAANSA